jgi:GntR family transcriptional regulator/MocR family aminotransferase
MPGTRSNSSLAAELLIVLDRAGPEPLHRQLEAAVRGLIRTGRLRTGTALPPTRALADKLGVSRGVVVEAYQQLTSEGYLTSRSGSYTQVAPRPEPAPPLRPPPPPPAQVRVDFAYGRADVSTFPRAAWLRALRRVLTEAPAERLGYLSGRGVPELRVALADYLNRVRGTAADPEDMVTCYGFAQGIALLISVLAARGARRIALEDPGPDDDARLLAPAAGLEVVPLPVGPDGIDVDALERSDADAVVLTPSHQWPTGGVLPAASRARIVAWAAARGALVIEDDYDAEYRYDRAPVGAMQGLSPEVVAYCGTASKTLAPGLRLGWLVLPRHLTEEVAAAKLVADRGSSVLDQLAFAEFLSRGEFDRHLRRMRPLYRRRRDLLLHALREHLPDLEPVGAAAGQHFVAWLPPDLAEEAVVTAAARRGVTIHGVAPYRIHHPGPAGLIFGYATLTDRAIHEGVTLLAQAITDLRAAEQRY